jgi:AcrR family transcriptional regulator
VSRPDTRDRILSAAAAVIRRGGARALTLEAAAAEAGVSKGGLLYHFPTKDALVDGLVEDWLDRFERQAEAGAGEEGWAHGYLAACDADRRPAAERATDVALLAALVGDPDRLDAVRRRYAAWQERLAAGGADPVEATIVRLAADGLWLADLLGLAPPRGRLRDAVLGRLAERGGPPARRGQRGGGLGVRTSR